MSVTTWNPSDKGAGVTLSGGNLTASVSSGATAVRATASTSTAPAKWYWEVTVASAIASIEVGVANATYSVSAGTDLCATTNSVAVRFNAGAPGAIVTRNSSNLSGAFAVVAGDVLGFAYDGSANSLAIYVNNVLTYTVLTANMPSGAIFPATGGNFGSGAGTATVNFGASGLAYAPPIGYSTIDALVGSTGTSAASRQNITAAGTGITSSGLSSATLQKITAAGAGINTSGQSAQTLQNITAAGATLPVFASAQVLQAIVVGPALPILNSAQTLQGIAAAGAGYFYQGSVLPAIIAAGAGSESQTGFSSQTLQSITAAGATALAGVSRVTLGSIVATSRGVEGAIGSSVASQLPFSAAGAGGFFAVGGSALVLPSVVANSRGYLGTGATFSAVVMHTESQALWTYTNFVFNSFARFNGKILAASDSGLFQLAGDNDNGVAIDASARLGITDFNTLHLKRVERVYMGYRSAGEMILRVRTDEVNVRDYLVPRTSFPGLHGNHVKLGRGLDALYWQFEVRNRNGSDFSLNMLECKPIVLKRRVGRDNA